MEILEEEHPGRFTWSTVDTTTDEGLARLRALRTSAGRQIPVPSIMADGVIIFDAVPDLDDLDDWMSANLAVPPEASQPRVPSADRTVPGEA